MSKKNDKPNLWIYYHARFRSPGSTDLYKYWKHNSTKFNVHLITDTAKGVTAEQVCKHRQIEMPDIVLDGFGGYSGCLKSFEDFQKNNTKIIRTVGDVEVHKGDFGGGHHEHNTDMFVDALYFPVSPDCHPPIQRLNEYREDLLAQENAKLICVPFGVDTDKFNPNTEKNIDISAMWMAEKANMFHGNRIQMQETLVQWSGGFNQNLSKYNQQVREIPDTDKNVQQLEMMKYFNNKKPISIWVDLDFYKYPEILNRSKMGLADTSRRQYMTNKYLELGASGCGIVGEMPVGYDDLLKDCMFPVDFNNIGQSMPQMIEYLLFDEQGKRDLHKKTGLLRKKILDGYTIKHWMDKLETEFSKLMG